MTSEEAKVVLSSVRPDSSDSHDPAFEKALKMLEEDADLRAWFEEQQAIDRVLSSKLCSFEPPLDLFPGIGAGLAISRNTRRWKVQYLIAAALIVAVAIPLAIYWGGGNEISSVDVADAGAGEAEFRKAMIEKIGGISGFDFVSADPSEIRGWLESQGRKYDFVIPEGIEDWPALGCKSLQWKGHEATLICFKLSEGESPNSAHLVVIEDDIFLDLKGPELEAHGEWVTAVWREGGKTYLLASVGELEDIRRLLG